jgi:hypothetical protein
MLSDFTRGLAATLGGDLVAGQVLLKEFTEHRRTRRHWSQAAHPPTSGD